MNLHEYQAKQLLSPYGLAIPPGRLVKTPDQAAESFMELRAPLCAIKSQIHAGGRGKGIIYAADNRGRTVLKGGVQLVYSADEARAMATAMLGNVLVTRQTGNAGRIIRNLYIESGFQIARELYLSVIIDRHLRRPVLIGSTAGGVDIEAVAERTPEKLLRLAFDPGEGLWDYQARQMAEFLNLTGPSAKQAVRFLKSLTRAFTELDCSLAEINPLAVTPFGDIMALDAKLNLDDNALYRHPEYESLRDLNEEASAETEARKADLSYIALDGNIGCMVNGAGLAMATMDAIKLYGGEPANFLDVGGGASQEKVAAAFRIILREHRVRAILVNIFGGIMKCDVIAEGILAALREVGLRVPLIVRLEGTNVEAGKRLLAGSGLVIHSATSLAQAAEQAVLAAGGETVRAIAAGGI